MKTSGEGATAKIAPKTNGTMADFLMQKARSFQQLLPRGMDADRFIRMALKAIIGNPKLAGCDKASMIIALGTAAELGLEPNGALGYGAIVPFLNRKRGILEAKFLLGYKGLLALMYRTGVFQTITAHEVCESDLFEYEYGLNAHLKHVPAIRDRGQVVSFYAYYKTKDGGFDFQVASKDELMEWGKRYSKSFEDVDSPWRTAPDEMCKKTLVRKLAKYGPIQVDLPSEDFEHERPEDLGRFDALLAEANAPAELAPPPKEEPKCLEAEAAQAAPLEQKSEQPKAATNGSGGKKPEEAPKPADRNPFDERIKKAKEAEARAESKRPRTLAERMHEDGPAPQEQQEIF